jgi:hypothetical protein
VIPVVNWEWMLTKYFGKKIPDRESLLNQSRDENLLSTESNSIVKILQKNPAGLNLEELVRDTGL